MSRSASSPSESSHGNKRQRQIQFAPADLVLNAIESSNEAKKPTSTAPSAVAKLELELIAETLPKELQPSALKLGAASISAYVAWQKKSDKLQSMKDDEDFLPKNLRFKVTADCLQEVKGGQEFLALEEELQAAVVKAGMDLKPYILKATQLNVSALRMRYLHSIALGLQAISELLLAYYNQEEYGKHRLVREYLRKNSVNFTATFNTTLQYFNKVYEKATDYVLFNHFSRRDSVEDAAPQHPEQQEGSATPSTPAATIPNPNMIPPTTNPAATDTMSDDPPPEEVDAFLQCSGAILASMDDFVMGVHRCTEKYEDQRQVLARAERLKNITSRQLAVSQTSTVHRRLEQEVRATAPTLQELIEETVAAANKDRDKKIAELTKALESKKESPKQKQKQKAQPQQGKRSDKSKTKNDGGAGGGAEKNKSTGQSTNRSTSNRSQGRDRKAAGSAGGTQSGALTVGKARSSSKQGKRRGKSKRRESGSTGASRRN
jgi:hypothetical protein